MQQLEDALVLGDELVERDAWSSGKRSRTPMIAARLAC